MKRADTSSDSEPELPPPEPAQSPSPLPQTYCSFTIVWLTKLLLFVFRDRSHITPRGERLQNAYLTIVILLYQVPKMELTKGIGGRGRGMDRREGVCNGKKCCLRNMCTAHYTVVLCLLTFIVSFSFSNILRKYEIAIREVLFTPGLCQVLFRKF